MQSFFDGLAFIVSALLIAGMVIFFVLWGKVLHNLSEFLKVFVKKYEAQKAKELDQ